ncbi:MAG: GNAT family N-acetyltransferase [Bacteroidaceae bacterium]|nr:GNAT family N-acetyltransferase [Bacteroidaceae bacterium]
MPFLWDVVDVVNSCLFQWRYGGALKEVARYLGDHCDASGGKDADSQMAYHIVPIAACDTLALVDFFAQQPEEAFTYFRPHGFDVKSLRKLQGYKSFLGYVVKDGDDIVGYFFLRSFFWGKTFIGRMVDVNHRGKGIAKMMNRVTMDIAALVGLRVFQTISPDNVSSMKSAEAVSTLRIIKTLPNGDLFVENLPLENDGLQRSEHVGI